MKIMGTYKIGVSNDYERESFPSNDNMPKDLPADAILMQFTCY